MNMHIAKGGFQVVAVLAAVSLLFYLISLAVPGIATAALQAAAGIVFLLTLFSLFFFRDPERSVPADPDVLLSPADGVVIDIREIEEPLYIKGQCKRISIFMSVFNVHVNRSPADGSIEFMHYNRGAFIAAFKEKASQDNESLFIGLRMKRDGIPIAVKFIAGLIARRIVFYGSMQDTVAQGERINLIRFGSRVELFCPPDAELAVKEGDAVRAGESVLARLRNR